MVPQEFKELCDRPALTGAIPLLLGVGTLNCTASPQQRNDPTPRLGVTSAKNANQRDPRASAEAESARNNLLFRAPCPQDTLKVQSPNSLDYRACYDTLARCKLFPKNLQNSAKDHKNQHEIVEKGIRINRNLNVSSKVHTNLLESLKIP